MSTQEQADWTAHGIIEAPADEVTQVLLHVEPGPATEDSALVLAAGPLGEHGPLVVSGGPRSFTARFGGDSRSDVRVETDPGRAEITLEGHWWYRGVYSVRPHPLGSEVTYRVYNIAPGPTQLLARLLNTGQRGKTADQLLQVLRAVGRRLGRPAYLARD